MIPYCGTCGSMILRRVATRIVPLTNRLCQLSFQKPIILTREKYGALSRCQVTLLAPYSQAMTSPVTPEKNLNYEDICKIIKDKSGILIDVREPKELKENGKLPESVNIPLNDVKTALQLPPEQFKKKYGIPLPNKKAPLVFSCQAGGRSMKALCAALELGYDNAKHYSGGFSDWKKNSSK